MNPAAAEPKQKDKERNRSLFSFTKKRVTLDFFAVLCYTEKRQTNFISTNGGRGFFYVFII